MNKKQIYKQLNKIFEWSSISPARKEIQKQLDKSTDEWRTAKNNIKDDTNLSKMTNDKFRSWKKNLLNGPDNKG